MTDIHRREYDSFVLEVQVDDEGVVTAVFKRDRVPVFSMDFDTLRDVIDFVGVHGLGMSEVWLNERDAEEVKA